MIPTISSATDAFLVDARYSVQRLVGDRWLTFSPWANYLRDEDYALSLCDQYAAADDLHRYGVFNESNLVYHNFQGVGTDA